MGRHRQRWQSRLDPHQRPRLSTAGQRARRQRPSRRGSMKSETEKRSTTRTSSDVEYRTPRIPARYPSRNPKKRDFLNQIS